MSEDKVGRPSNILERIDSLEETNTELRNEIEQHRHRILGIEAAIGIDCSEPALLQRKS